MKTERRTVTASLQNSTKIIEDCRLKVKKVNDILACENLLKVTVFSPIQHCFNKRINLFDFAFTMLEF